MKVVDIHPEELIDKLNAGSLSGAEHERLSAHLAQCAACRFEISVRDDFEQEAPSLSARPQLRFGTELDAPRPAEPRVSPSIRARRRRRWPLVAIAAAFVLCAGGATAAVVTGAMPAPRWLPWVPEASAPSAALSASVAKSNRPKLKFTVTKGAALEAPAPVEPAAQPSEQAAQVASVEPSAVAVDVAPVAPHHVVAATVASSARRAPSSAVFAPPGEPTSAAARAEASTPRVDPAAALFADANRARRDGNIERAIVLYRSLQSRFPSSAESELSRALLAQLLLDRGSPEAALAGFDRYLAEGTPVLGAEALVGRARALEQLGKSAQAIMAWQAVQESFPGSVHARLATTRIAALGER